MSPTRLLKSRSSLRGALTAYSVFFAAVCLMVYGVFLVMGKSLVWDADGISQHYPALSYIGRWGREVIRNLLSGDFTVPVWDFGIGYGADAVTTLHYYGLGDPLNFLSVLVPARYTEYLYNLLVILRIWLCGTTFLLYCRRMKQDLRAAVLGALLYAFSGWTFYAAVRHPFFMTPMVYLPLILIGAEKVLHRENPLLFIAAVALCLLSSFYFSYMVVIFVIAYVVLRFVHKKHHRFVKEMLTDIGRFAGFGLVAVLTASVIFLPVLIVYFGSGRAAVEVGVPLLYDLRYYDTLFGQLLGYHDPSYWNMGGYSPLSLVAVFFIFLRKGCYRPLKIAFVLLLGAQLLPAAGYALNGFGYVTNRFLWAFAFLLAFITVYVLKDMLHATLEEKKKLTVVTVAYTLAVLVLCCGDSVIGAVQLTLLVGILPVLWAACDRHRAASLAALIAVFSVCANGIFCNSPLYNNYVEEFIDSGTARDTFEDSPATLFAEDVQVTDASFARFESVRETDKEDNQALFNNTAGVGFFFSLTNDRVSQYLQEMEVPVSTAIHYHDLDHRTCLDTLASVKYHITKDGLRIPYGYKQVGEQADYQLYENKYALPLGYTYDRVITREAYDKLNAVEKQEALMQAVLLEEWDETDTVTLTSSEVPFTITYSDDVVQTDDGIYVKKKGATMKLQTEEVAKGELYLRFTNLQATYLDEYELAQRLPQSDGEDSAYVKTMRLYDHLYKKDKNVFSLRVAGDGVTQNVRLLMPEHQFYSGIHDFTVNMGYHAASASHRYTVTFPAAGFYSWDTLELLRQPLDNYKKYTRTLSADTLEGLSLSDNRVSGSITLKEDKVLCLTLPYSAGWACYVDGEKTELLQANTWCMAVPLTAGRHDIRLEYRTPGLMSGAVCSCVGVLLMGIIGWYYTRKRKKAKA